MAAYETLIPDYDAFKAVASTPLPFTLRVNTVKTTRTRLRNRLETQGFTVEQHPANPDVFTVDANPAKTMEHWTGMFYMQETAATIAPRILNPEKNETVLDMAAAPGGKTTYLAQLMENTGGIVANDKSGKRLKALHANTYRLGAVNVAATQYDGRHLPEDQLFDHVLLDAPCTGEGNVREKNRGVERDASASQALHTLQSSLLAKAVALTKPGGSIVYSTCTFAPEENEAVVSNVLDTHADIELEPVSVDAPHSPGVTEWEHGTFRNDMDRCIRIYPYHMDSGGAFIAKLRKT